jgi:hypothetical protein
MIKRLFRRYLINLLLSDVKLRRLIKEIALTNIEKHDGSKTS